MLEYVAIHLGSVARGLQLPTQTLDGQPLVIPYPGMFHTWIKDRAALYDESHQATLAMYMAEFAEAMDSTERAASWRLKGLELSRSYGQVWIAVALGTDLVPFLVLDDRHLEALNIALETCAYGVALEEIQRSGKDPRQPGFDMAAMLEPRSNEHWYRVEQRTAIYGLLPTAFRLSTITLSDAETASSFATAIANWCRERSAIASNQVLWTMAADLIRDSYQRQASVRSLVTYLEPLDKNAYAVLGAIAYLGASLQRDSSLEDSLLFHVAISSFAYRSWGPSSSLYSKIALPFIESYWQTAFARMRFRFRAPQMIEKNITDALLLPVTRRAQEIIKAVAFGLNIRLPSESQDWLDSIS